MRIFLFFKLLLNCHILYSQVEFPRVEKALHPVLRIDGSFSPAKEFLKNNPLFLSEGKYVLKDFNSVNFPAIFFTANDKLNESSNIRIRFVSKNIFPVDEENAFNDPIDLNYYEVKNYLKGNFDRFGSNNEHGKKAYISFNKDYINSISQIVKNKYSSDFSISNLGVYDYDLLSTDVNLLIFELEYIDNNLIESSLTPCYVRYRLNVKNVFDSLIKSYKQVIFFSGKLKDKSIGFNAEYVSVYQTYQVAFQSLFNQYLLDPYTREKIRQMKRENSETTKISVQNAASLIELSYTRNAILKLLDIVNYSLKFYGDMELVDLNRVTLTQDPVANSVASLAHTIIGSLDAASQRKKINKLNRIGNDLISVLSAMSERESSLIEELSQDNEIYTKFILAGTYTPLNADLASEFNRNMENAFAANRKMQSVIGNNINYLMNSVNRINFSQFSSKPEVSAMTSTATKVSQNGMADMDECQQKATAEWYKSQEYRTYMSTKNNADAYDAQAKITELTLKYCSDKLPPNEISMMQKQASDSRKVAANLRRNVNFNFK